jgi:RNA polymerase sigma factor (sigma-70 family)
MDLQQRSEPRFNDLLSAVFKRRRPHADRLAHPMFRERGLGICYYLARGTSCEPEDLFQDLRLKLLKSGAMPLPDKTPDEDAYFRWLFKVVLRMRIDYFRSNRTRLQQEVPLGDILPRAAEIPDLGLTGPELDALLGEFAEYAAKLPDKIRRVIELRQEGLTYKAIAEVLTSDGEPCSEVAVRKWFKDCLKEFFKCGEGATAGKSARKTG